MSRPEWDYLLTELVGGSSDPDAPALANKIEAAFKEIERQRDQAIRLSNLSKSLLDDANAECVVAREAFRVLADRLACGDEFHRCSKCDRTLHREWQIASEQRQRDTVLPYSNNWRPMDTAPKTGASIIYRYMEGSNVRAGLMCWMQTFSATESAEDTPCWWDLGLDDEAHKPTGWIPLPGGPA